MAGLPPKRPEPARGAVAGIKADLARAKEKGESYDPRGQGNAFTHNFLNQKPWHPMNFKNQIRKFEAEQRLAAEQKAREQGQAEFEAEQERIRAMSYLSEKEQQRLSMAWMYTKPPGLDAALAKEDATSKAKQQQEAAGAAAASSSVAAVAAQAAQAAKEAQQAQREQAVARAVQLDRVREDPVAAMLAARENLHNNERFIVKQAEGTFGGFSRTAQNQQLLGADDHAQAPPLHLQQAPGPPGSRGLASTAAIVAGGVQQQQVFAGAGVGAGSGVVADAEDLAVLAAMSSEERVAVLKRLEKLQRRAERQKQLEEAQAVLRAAGFDLDALQQQQQQGGGDGGQQESKHKKKHKRKRKHKKDGGGSKSGKQRQGDRRSKQGASCSSSGSSDDTGGSGDD